MNRTGKIIVYILIFIGIIVLILSLTANSILKSKVEDSIKEGLPAHIISSYEEITVRTLDGSVYIKSPSFTIKNKTDSIAHTFLNADNLKIEGFSYWDYLFHKRIHINRILLENPSTIHYKARLVADTVPEKNSPEIKKPLFVEELKIQNSRLAIYDKEKDSTKLFIQDFSFQISEVEVNDNTIKSKIPLVYKNITAKGDSIFVKANPYENLVLQSFSVENSEISLNNLAFKTKYSRSELSRMISVERDHFDLTIKSLSLQDFDFGYKSDSLFFVDTKKIILNAPALDIYRDKLVADDMSIKPLYSKALRELPFDLTVDSVKINKGFLKYEEKVQEENSGGAIQFKNLAANISNLSNTYSEPETTDIKINAIFMDNTPLSIDWNFNVQNLHDQFIFKANIGSLKAENMNRFTEPNLKVRLEGVAEKTFFTIDGNNENSKTDLKIHFSDFKVTILQKDGKKKNKFLSAVVNIFVSKDSEKKDDKFKEGSGVATRDKTKSVFNQLWNSVKSALSNTIM